MAHGSPKISAPSLYTTQDLKQDPLLVTRIIHLINDAFTRSKKSDPVKWGEKPRIRFTDIDTYFEMLGSDGTVAAIFDNNAGERRLVAVAAAVPWQGGWTKEGAGTEEGWEIKAVAVDGDARYLRKGLAVQLYNSLEERLFMLAEKLQNPTTQRKSESKDQLTLWILAAECINGLYWRKRGFEIVRRNTAEAPTWGVLTKFEMIVLQKHIPLRPSKEDSHADFKSRAAASISHSLEVT